MNVNVGRGGSQKAHALSPLDIRLTTYVMAMFNFDYNLISSLNSFNTMGKDRYLSYIDNHKLNKFVSINLNNKEFGPIRINKMPLCSENMNTYEYNIECLKCNIKKLYNFEGYMI